MYRWQTLTLARLECAGAPQAIRDSVRQFLYDVGLANFPAPDVATPASTADCPVAELRWHVDGRTLAVMFHGPGGYTTERTEDGRRQDPPPYTTDLALIRCDVHWLLFGEEPPARFVAAPGAGIGALAAVPAGHVYHPPDGPCPHPRVGGKATCLDCGANVTGLTA